MSVVLLLLPTNTGATVGSMPKQHLEVSLVSSSSAFFSVLSALVFSTGVWVTFVE